MPRYPTLCPNTAGMRGGGAESCSKSQAEQPPAADALQPPMRCGFRAQRRRSVRPPNQVASTGNPQGIILKYPTVRPGIIFALGIIVAPLATDAETPKKVFRLGYVLPAPPGAYTRSSR